MEEPAQVKIDGRIQRKNTSLIEDLEETAGTVLIEELTSAKEGK
jgi:hypothetical protein